MLASRNDLGPGVLQGIELDTLARSNTRDELERVTRHNDLILNSMADGILGLDRFGRITFANSSALKMLGRQSHELLAQSMHELVHHSKSDGAPCMEEDCFVCNQKNITFFDMDEVFWRKDGSSFPIEAVKTPIEEEGEEVGTVIVFKDLTERKQADKERLQLATAIEQAAESVIITDTEGGIQYANPSLEALSGYSREEIVGRNARILKSGKHSPEFYRTMWETILSGETWTGHLSNRKKDGALYELEGTISPVRDMYGKITNFVSVMRDVTAKSQLEKQVRQLQKMEAIGTLASGIAHDFNNILTAIMGYTELAMCRVTEGPLKTNLEAVLNAGCRAGNLVKQILSFSRRTEQKFVPVKLSPIVTESLRFLRASLPATIEIRQKVCREEDVILADPTQIHQVLMNLCTNARHAMLDSGGILEVKLAGVVLNEHDSALYQSLAPGPYLELVVSDTGHGMDQSTLERIFDPFFTTKKRGEGTGLGLSVVHGIIKRHKGDISVQSDPGKGSTFTVLLPTIEDEHRFANADEIGPGIAGGSECILFVDDEDAIVAAWKDILTGLGYNVVTCRSGMEALGCFYSQPGRFNIIITDQTMPQMTGMDFAREVLGIRPDVPILLCTGFIDSVSEEKAKELGIREVVMKPFTRRQFAETIRSVLDGQVAASPKQPAGPSPPLNFAGERANR
ncbi:MAG: PAS domain S-box protein [Syntrophobacteraceae bacterium]